MQTGRACARVPDSRKARDWKNSGRDPTYLYSGARLAVAEEWAASHPGELSIDEAEFLSRSREAQKQREATELEAARKLAEALRERAEEAEKREREEKASSELRERLAREEKERQEREIDAAQRLARAEAARAEEAEKRAKEQKQATSKLRRLARMLALVAVAAAAIFGFWQKGEAEKQAKYAEQAASQANVFLALNSNAIGNSSQELAYLAKALKLNGKNSEAGALTPTLLTQESWPVVTGVMKHHDAVSSAQFSADGQRVVTASSDKTARVWDIPTITRKDSADDVNLLADLAEATGGLALQVFGQIEILSALTPDQIKAMRDKIAARFERPSSALTPVERLLKWTVSDPRRRTISPFSKLTFPRID